MHLPEENRPWILSVSGISQNEEGGKAYPVKSEG